MTTLSNNARFLKGVGALFSAFSIHEKHDTYTLCNLSEAISKVGNCLNVLEENVRSIRSMDCVLPQTLNGPQGSVAAKTVNSVQLTKWGLKRLKQNLHQHGYEHANLLSCMTLDVENLHSVVHHKSQVSTAFQYARDFGRTAKEGLKRTAYWSVYYYTNRGSWYMVPDRPLGLFDIPAMQQPPVVAASSGQIAEMREWSRTYGASVRQRSVRQETTMARAGTLPDYLYQKEVRVGEKVNLNEPREALNKRRETYRILKSMSSMIPTIMKTN